MAVRSTKHSEPSVMVPVPITHDTECPEPVYRQESPTEDRDKQVATTLAKQAFKPMRGYDEENLKELIESVAKRHLSFRNEVKDRKRRGDDYYTSRPYDKFRNPHDQAVNELYRGIVSSLYRIYENAYAAGRARSYSDSSVSSGKHCCKTDDQCDMEARDVADAEVAECLYYLIMPLKGDGILSAKLSRYFYTKHCLDKPGWVMNKHYSLPNELYDGEWEQLCQDPGVINQTN